MEHISTKTKFLDRIRYFFRFPLMEGILIGLKTSSSAFAKLVPNYYQYKPNSIRTFTRNGIKFRADISEWLGYCAYFNVKNDPYDALFSLVKPGMNVLDIGSNMGFVALNMAKKLGEKGIVYAFEPDAHNYTVLKQNIELNPALPVKALQLAMGNSTEKLKLEVINTQNRGENKITNTPATSNYTVVDVVKADDFVAQQAITKIDLVKIDTEGFEMTVLRGAEETIKKFKPVLFIEVNDENLKQQKSSAKELVSLILSWGYKITSAQTSETIDSTSNLEGCQFDVVCQSN
jgi:FkbM family methyltransferase